MATATPQSFQSASLYVGDLHSEATEGLLFELFNRVGPVASIRVCRDAITRRSLGYSYVNFHNYVDAERALDTMNFTEIKGKACRIMWSQRDPSLRKSGVGNVFIKNLPPSVDNKALFDTFSVFGNILSCKVATDDTGASKGYGYVHYETAEAAEDAIFKFNGNSIDDHEVSVTLFVRRGDRADNVGWTNLYVKSFPESWDEEKLKSVFGEYGTIANVMLKRDEDGKSKRFGFVNFADHEAAVKAQAELNGKQIEGAEGEESTELYVNRAQKKSERDREISTRLAAMNQERASKYQGMNLYVKNLDDSITDEFFKETFAQFGTITSARIMRDSADPTVSKGFGFICYSSPEEATRAVTEMNGKILRSKPIVVTLHQRKELRRAHLAQTYAPRNMRGYPQPGGGMGPYGGQGMYMAQLNQAGGFPRGYPGMPFAGGAPRGSPRGAPGFAGRAQPGFPMPSYAAYGMPPQGMQNGQMVGLRRPPAAMGGPGAQMGQDPRAMPGGPQQGLRRPMPMAGPNGRAGMPMQGAYPQQGMGGRPGPAGAVVGGVKFNNQVRNPGQANLAQGPATQMGSGGLNNELDDQILAQADPAMQKNMIGERLYPLIYVHQPEKAGKITGMLLEMDNAELLNLIESPHALTAKIDEALSVLKSHQTEASGERQ